MKCCCSNILDLCKVGTCTGSMLRTGVNATQAGQHVLVVEFLGTQFRINRTIELGAEIVFPVSGLNEDYVFKGFILQPDGTQLTITVDEVDYDCIEFQTQISYLVGEVADPATIPAESTEATDSIDIIGVLDQTEIDISALNIAKVLFVFRDIAPYKLITTGIPAEGEILWTTTTLTLGTPSGDGETFKILFNKLI